MPSLFDQLGGLTSSLVEYVRGFSVLLTYNLKVEIFATLTKAKYSVYNNNVYNFNKTSF
jgi:hypothetical protein